MYIFVVILMPNEEDISRECVFLVSQRQCLCVGFNLVERQVKMGNNFTPNKRKTHSLCILNYVGSGKRPSYFHSYVDVISISNIFRQHSRVLSPIL